MPLCTHCQEGASCHCAHTGRKVLSADVHTLSGSCKLLMCTHWQKGAKCLYTHTGRKMDRKMGGYSRPAHQTARTPVMTHPPIRWAARQLTRHPLHRQTTKCPSGLSRPPDGQPNNLPAIPATTIPPAGTNPNYGQPTLQVVDFTGIPPTITVPTLQFTK